MKGLHVLTPPGKVWQCLRYTVWYTMAHGPTAKNKTEAYTLLEEALNEDHTVNGQSMWRLVDA